MDITNERLNQLINHINNGDLMKFYKSREWMSLRLVALKRDNHECQMCKAKGKYHRAENVHHMKEVNTHPHLSLELNNLMCLCISCHNDIHERRPKERKVTFSNEERW